MCIRDRLYQRDPVLRRVLDQLKVGFRDGVTYEDLFQRLVTGMDGQADQYMVLADFAAYCEAESRMRHTYRDRETWNRMSLTNICLLYTSLCRGAGERGGRHRLENARRGQRH